MHYLLEKRCGVGEERDSDSNGSQIYKQETYRVRLNFLPPETSNQEDLVTQSMTFRALNDSSPPTAFHPSQDFQQALLKQNSIRWQKPAFFPILHRCAVHISAAGQSLSHFYAGFACQSILLSLFVLAGWPSRSPGRCNLVVLILLLEHEPVLLSSRSTRGGRSRRGLDLSRLVRRHSIRTHLIDRSGRLGRQLEQLDTLGFVCSRRTRLELLDLLDVQISNQVLSAGSDGKQPSGGQCTLELVSLTGNGEGGSLSLESGEYQMGGSPFSLRL